MKIRFTIALSDETVNAFKACGFEDSEDIKNELVRELREFFDKTKDEAVKFGSEDESEDEDPEDDEDGEEEFEDAPAPPPTPKKKPATRRAKK